MKKIIFIGLAFFYSFVAYAQVKTFDIKMTPCDVGSNCHKCSEVIAVKYDVDSQNKVVKISGTSIQGEEISEVLKICDVQDISNWSCRHAAVSVSVKNNIVSIETNKNSSMYTSGKQICLIK